MRHASLPFALTAILLSTAHAAPPDAFFTNHCLSCHDSDTKKGNLDIAALKRDFADSESFTRLLNNFMMNRSMIC